MINFHRKVGNGLYQVEAIVVLCGTDVLVCFGGGQKNHIGASALAVPRPSLQDKEKISATASVIAIPGHKDDELARHAALNIAASLECCAAVTVGLHIDGAIADDIDMLLYNFHALLEEVKTEIRKAQPPIKYNKLLSEV